MMMQAPMPSNAPRHDWARTLQVVVITQAVILVGFNFAFPFLPLFIQELGVTEPSELALWTGIVIGVPGLVMAVISPVWGLLADRFGRKVMLVRSVAAGSVLLALQAAIATVGQLLAIRVLQGALTGTQTAAAMLVAGVVPRERTGFALGLLNTAAYTGNLAGPILGSIAVAAIGLRGSFFIGALLLAGCAVVTMLFVTDPPIVAAPVERPGIRGGVREMLAPFAWPSLRGVLVIGTVVQIVSAGSYALIAIYVQQLARPPYLSVALTIGLSLALTALAAAVSTPLLGSYADRHDARGVLSVSLAVIAFALVPQALVQDAVVFLAFRFVLGFGLAGAIAASAVLTRAGAPAGAEGRAFGTLAAAQNLGWGTGPLAGSALAAAAGIPTLFLACALVTLLLVPVSMSRGWFAPIETPAVGQLR